jgi:hypothetical protein
MAPGIGFIAPPSRSRTRSGLGFAIEACLRQRLRTLTLAGAPYRSHLRFNPPSSATGGCVTT